MRILVLTKRQYMGKDLLDDMYGRFYELAKELAHNGHSILGVCLSYRKRDDGKRPKWKNEPQAFEWYSYNIGNLLVVGLYSYLRKLRLLAGRFKPDIIFACSDSFHIIFGAWLSKVLNVPCVIDLYDNFESYGATKIPGVLFLFKWAVRNAKGITCVSSSLRKFIISKYKPLGEIITLENAIWSDLFYGMDKIHCRERLGLPRDGKFIGTAGSLYLNRGIEDLFKGFEILSTKNKELRLIVAGRLDRKLTLPSGSNVHYLGELPLEDIPYLLNTLDVGVICNLDTAFGRYCFPQKAYEMIACGIPLVASAVGEMKEFMRECPLSLFEPGNTESFVKAVDQQLRNACRLNIAPPNWGDLTDSLEKLMRSVQAGASYKHTI
jgi:teichuronic acid biosynthesis glycosyltransferase TuaC